MVWMLAISGKLKKHYIHSTDITDKIFSGECYKRPGGDFEFEGDFRRSDVGRMYLKLDGGVVAMAREGACYNEVLNAQRDNESKPMESKENNESRQFELSDYM